MSDETEVSKSGLLSLMLGWIGNALGMEGEWTNDDLLKRAMVIGTEIADLQAENARLAGIVAKLPRTADGVPVVPEMKLWGNHPLRGLIDLTVQHDLTAKGEYNGTGWPVLNLKDCYSTREEAASAAAKGEL